MSINDFMDKIKGQFGIDRITLLCLCVIFFVGISSFGLGRLSVSDNLTIDNKNITTSNEQVSTGIKIENNIQQGETDNNKKRMYVASKNGKLYYNLGCSGANRISPKNEVWFATALDAEKTGYTLSSSCK